MKHSILIYIIILLSILACKTSSVTPERSRVQVLEPTKVRQIRPSEVNGFHKPLEMQVAWFPYEDRELKLTGDNEWGVFETADQKAGQIPMILVRYPASGDSIWLDMNTENQMLGKLLKHSLITQVPIKRPFLDFFQDASCTNCHPSDVKVDFDK